MFKNNGSPTGMQPASTTIITIYMTFEKHGVLQSSFLIRSRVGGVRFPTNSIPPEYHIMKAEKYGMIAYFLEIFNPKNSFFHCLTKFQKCMFMRIHLVFASPKSPIKFPYNRSVDVEVYSAVIEYENGKAKPADYLIRLADLEDLDNQ